MENFWEGELRKELLEILVCPTCKGELSLTTDRARFDEVIAGYLQCAGCNENYPIEDSIPNLLPPDMRQA